LRPTRVVLIVLASVLLAAHLSRAGLDVPAGLALLLPLLLLVRGAWAAPALRVVLLLGGLEWIRTLLRLVGERRAAGEDWARLAAILLAVTLVTFAAAAAVRPRRAPEPGGGEG
jgi:hypothetical protein